MPTATTGNNNMNWIDRLAFMSHEHFMCYQPTRY